MKTTSTILTLISVLALVDPALGDTIQVGQQIHKNVYVTLDKDNYQILLPETGEVLSVPNVRRDVKLIGTSPEEERDSLHARWEKNHALKQGVLPPKASSKTESKSVAPASPEEGPHPKKLTSFDLRQRQAFEDSAEFETQLLLWAQIPDDFRRKMFAQVAALANSTAELNVARMGDLRESRAANSEAIAGEAAALAKERQRSASSLQHKQNELNGARSSANSRIKLYEASDMSGYYGAIRDSRLQSATFNELMGKSGGYYRSSARYWDDLAQDEAARTDARITDIADEYSQKEKAIRSEAKQIAGEYKSVARAADARMQALEDANSRARTDETVLKMNTEEAIDRAERDLDRMSALEDALGNNYALTIPFKQAAELHAANTDEEAHVAVNVTGRLWRVFWAIDGPAQGSRLASIAITDDATGRPIAGSSDNVAPHKRFLLLKGPGRFTLKVSGTQGSEVVAVADEVAPQP